MRHADVLARVTAVTGLALAALLAGAPLASAAPPAQPGADPGLREAVRRDLGLSWEDYVQRGVAAERAAQLDAELANTPGYHGVSLDGSAVVVSGDGQAVRDAARRAGARTDGRRTARAADDIAARYASAVGNDGVQSVAVTATGVEIRATDPTRVRAGRTSPEKFAAANPGVRVVAARGPAVPHAINGGEGYSMSSTLCSIGFAAFTATGGQAMASAGHCTVDGSLTQAVLETDPRVSLGRAVFSQFGGAGNTSNSASQPGIDLTIFEGSAPDLVGRTQTWSGSTVAVSGQTTAVVNAPVCTSGRTTRAWRCGRVMTTGVYNVQGHRGETDVRWVAGFETDVVTRPGDSGGPILQGAKALGMVSAGYDAWTDPSTGIFYPPSTVGAPVTELTRRGYALEFWLNAPVVGAGAQGAQVTGRIPVDGSLPPGTVVELNRNGTLTRITPAANGSFTYAALDGDRLTAVAGFSRSETVTWTPAYGTTSGGLICGLRNNGCLQAYAEGTVYWSASTPRSLVKGAIRDRWGSLGWENGRLGYPLSGEVCGLRDGGCFQRFEGGSMYFSPAGGTHPVWGAMGGPWAEQGWENGAMGYPTSDEMCGLRDGGCRQDFQDGSVTWASGPGAHFVRGAIAREWRVQGAQQGWLGYPLTNEMCRLVDGGCWQVFQGGRVYWSPASGAHHVRGEIGRAWDATDYEHGRLGYPTSGEFCGLRDGGCGQHFQRGTIYWSARSGAHPVNGAIRDRYAALGWEGGHLAYPVMGENCGLINSGCFQRFQDGSIYFSPASGVWEVWGAIYDHWASTGWETGRLGYPSGPEVCDAGGCRQGFERGTVTWSLSGGARG
ncbi:hypothetical protein [Mariniluteicoccus flavus]